jgi:hypothetical protein
MDAGRCESAVESAGTGLSCADLRILAEWDAKSATVWIVDRTVTCVKVDQRGGKKRKSRCRAEGPGATCKPKATARGDLF